MGRNGEPMLMRLRLSDGLLSTFLLVLLVTGCAKKASMSPEAPETETMRPAGTSLKPPQESEEELAARRDRESQAAIEERERRVVEESMRRRLGGPVQAAPAMTMTQEEFSQQDVNFTYDSFTLSAEAKTILEHKATWLKENSQVRVQIEGHCDERGTTAYNLALGERRANTVRQYLVVLGVNAARLRTISYGEEFPLDPGHTEEAWARNRRAHFVITSQ
jgi:peptidoglycan-associated lipoprotein